MRSSLDSCCSSSNPDWSLLTGPSPADALAGVLPPERVSVGATRVGPVESTGLRCEPADITSSGEPLRGRFKLFETLSCSSAF